MIWIAAAAVWGFAEATLFFIVPDVLLTYAVLKFGLKRALQLSAVAAAAAVLGGIVLWLWSGEDAEAARHAMLMVPAVGPDLLARAGRETAGFWPLDLVVGAVTGMPYKLYAVEAGAGHQPPGLRGDVLRGTLHPLRAGGGADGCGSRGA